ncbi:DUF2971 domain-containing protein [Flavobacterium xinjiangense]|uniref:DUF2971 domain-containing protein n=1 Tax=Flavobacterium xinjiangense TaxID=178356 RepID=A0A1M7PSD4_9FLAO|nr:DUF2971 domain-containing protein [Flavobacterium xinjiangense]SHN20344.1 Protein of unknown function [Flavobacterium xinjiangense]
MYRLRSIYNLLDGHQELENQEIYFAPSEDLNDPMEGFLDVYWDGDAVVWENLLKHFLMCIEQVFTLNLVGGEAINIKSKEIPVFKNRSTYPTNQAKEIYLEIEKCFFDFDYINKLPENLSSRNNSIRRDELITYLRLVHAYAIQSITTVYQKHNFIKNRSDGKRFEELQKFIKEKDLFIDILNRTEKEFSGNDDLASTFFSVAGKVADELSLLSAFNSTLSTSSNKFFLFNEFPQAYVSRIEEITYPNWYTACFMSSCNNSSIWGHYGEQHKGVCLKFKTSSIGEKIQLNIEKVNGCNENGVTIGMVPLTFYKVNYENKHIEIDFFKSLGRLQVFILRSHWYTDKEGNVSKCADPISKDPEVAKKWHSEYWKSFYRGVTTKLEDWNYENEYRLIVTNMLDDFDTVKSRKLKYDFSSLEGIIFGIKTSNKDKLKIMKIVDDKCTKYNRTDFNFYQAYYSKETGKIEYELLSLIKPV